MFFFQRLLSMMKHLERQRTQWSLLKYFHVRRQRTLVLLLLPENWLKAAGEWWLADFSQSVSSWSSSNADDIWVQWLEFHLHFLIWLPLLPPPPLYNNCAPQTHMMKKIFPCFEERKRDLHLRAPLFSYSLHFWLLRYLCSKYLECLFFFCSDCFDFFLSKYFPEIDRSSSDFLTTFFYVLLDLLK